MHSFRLLLSSIVVLSVLGPAPAALAQEASLGTFQDVPLDHWAFLTVEMLARKYKVMAGFPDQTFRGDKTVSRYELSAALSAVLDRMDALSGQGKAIAPEDLGNLTKLLKDYGIDALKGRVDKLEADTKTLTDKGLPAISVSGGMGSSWMDDTQDDQAPYMSTGFGIDLKGTVSGLDLYAGMGGGVPAVTVGNKPATAGSDKPPDKLWRFNGAHVTAHVGDLQIRTGMYSPDSFFGTGSDLANNWGDGVVGNGMIHPNVNTVRWGDKSAAIALNRPFGPVTATVAVTPTTVMGGATLKLSDALRFKFSADTDQPNWGDLSVNKASSYNAFAVADLGTDKLGLSLQGGLSKSLIQASASVTWSPWGDTRLGLGAIFRTSEKATTELTPGVSFFFPQLSPMIPSVLLGLKEPQIIATEHGNVGPGSLLGEQAGFSSTLGWKLEDYGYPNIKLEYNLQQPVLFYEYYEATFAVDVSRGF